jgi:methylisocitrate lyase
MPWIIDQPLTQQQLYENFKELVIQESILQIPGAHDAMAGLIAKQVGFKALYLSGAALTASKGLPDLGIVTLDEVVNRAKEIIRATQLPLLVDIDTGFGGILNVARTAVEMVEAGVAAIQIEDQDLPKKCGHLNGKKLVTAEEMAQKIYTIKKVAPSLYIVARTDAFAVEGLDSAVKRAELYIEAGADAIFPEALEDKKDFIKFKETIKVPLLANMTEFGRTPYYTAEQFKNMGYSMVIYPVTSLRVAAKAYENVFKLIKNTGTQIDALNNMQLRSELYETISYYKFEELDQTISKTILSDKQ